MDNKRYHIFISYRRKGRDKTVPREVMEFYNKLKNWKTPENETLSVFLDKEELTTSSDWECDILKAIDNSEMLIFALVEESDFDRCTEETDVVYKEIGYALAKGKPCRLLPFMSSRTTDEVIRKTLESNNNSQIREIVEQMNRSNRLDGIFSDGNSQREIQYHSVFSTIFAILNIKDPSIRIKENFTGSVVRFESDSDCYIKEGNDYLADITNQQGERFSIIHLQQGMHSLRFISKQYPAIELRQVLKIKNNYSNLYRKICLEDDIIQYRKLMYNDNIDKSYLEKLIKIADEYNNPDAQYNLGLLYYGGHIETIDGKPNYEKAKEWWEKAAENEQINAQLFLGLLYDKGHIGTIDGKPNYEKAKEWWERAAKKGNSVAQSVAQYQLGLLYYGGHIETIDGKPNYEKAKEWWEKAEKGEAYAQYGLGELYYDGHIETIDGKPNYEKAKEWWEKAAEKGDANAQYCLGKLYYEGHIGTINGKPDYEKAKKWLEKAAENGLTTAQHGLGLLYYKGLIGLIDGKPDYEKAKEWLEKAAEKGDATAQYNLGLLYYKGLIGLIDGKPDYDYEKAKEWLEKAAENGLTTAEQIRKAKCSKLEKAAENGLTTAQNDLGLLYYGGHIGLIGLIGLIYGKPDYDYEKAKEWLEKAKEWLEKAAENGLTTAQNDLGLLYYNGHIGAIDGIPDYEKAKEWLEKAAEKGYAEAQYNLGLLYYDGKPDYEKAKEWWEKAAEKGYATAQYSLGKLYYKGHIGTINGKPDYEKAKEWWEKAAEEGAIDALYHLGELYYEGRIGTINGEPDFKTAAKYYEDARLNAGHDPSSFFLGKLYEDKLEDYEKAKEWYSKAIQEDDDCEAMLNLADLYRDGLLKEESSNEIFKQLYQQAMNKGSLQAMYNLAEFIEEKEQNPRQAGELFIKILETPNIWDSQKLLGDTLNKIHSLYNTGNIKEDTIYQIINHFFNIHITVSNSSIIKFYEFAAEFDAKYSLKLGDLYDEGGEFTHKNFSEAFKWYKKAAERGNPEAQYKVGLYLELGKCRQEGQNKIQAIEWYKKAADKDHAIALEKMGDYYYSKEDWKNARLYYMQAAEKGNNEAKLKLRRT